MIHRLSRAISAVLRWARLRPPIGHMDMLRGVVDRREDDRQTRESDATGRWPTEGTGRLRDTGE